MRKIFLFLGFYFQAFCQPPNSLPLLDVGFNHPITSSIFGAQSSYYFPSKISEVEGQEVSFGFYDAPFKYYWKSFFPLSYMGVVDFKEFGFNSIYLLTSLPWGFTVSYIRNNIESDLALLTMWHGDVGRPLIQKASNNYLLGYSFLKGNHKVSIGGNLQDMTIDLFDLLDESVWTLSLSSHYTRHSKNKIDNIKFGVNFKDLILIEKPEYFHEFNTIDGFYEQSFFKGSIKLGVVKRLVKIDTSTARFNSTITKNQSIEVDFWSNRTATFNFRIISEGMFLLGSNLNIPIESLNKKLNFLMFRIMFGNNNFAISEWDGNGSYFSLHTTIALNLLKK